MGGAGKIPSFVLASFVLVGDSGVGGGYGGRGELEWKGGRRG